MLHQNFKLKDLGSLNYFLDLELALSSDGIFLSQRKCILELLEDTGLLTCKPSSLPMDPHDQKLHSFVGDLFPDPSIYQRLVGKLLYINVSRPDISVVVQASVSLYLSHKVLTLQHHTQCYVI